ncbi:MAG: hypothetical protein U1A78_15295 [Polyangia bacterium]
MSEENDWKQRAIQHDLAAFAARARRSGAQERRYTDEEGRLRLIEHVGRTKIIKTYLNEEGLIAQVTVTTVREELRQIREQWDEMAPKITSEMLAKLLVVVNDPDSTAKQQTSVRIALGHIWRRRKDLRAEITRVVPDIRRHLKAGSG